MTMTTKTFMTALSLAVAAGIPFATTTHVEPRTAPPAPVRAPAVDEELDVRDLALVAKVSLRDAIRAALDARPGRAVEAELEGERRDGRVVAHYSVTLLTAEHVVVEVEVDATSGAVLGVEEEDDEAEERAAFVRVLRHAERSLEQLVEAAESFVKGTPVAAELEFEQRMPLCEVDFVHTRYVIEVEVEARACHLLEIELEEEEAEEEEAEGEEHGEDQPHEHGEVMRDTPDELVPGQAVSTEEVSEEVVTEQEVSEQVVTEPSPAEKPLERRR